MVVSAKKRRRVEAHRLTISGLGQAPDYGKVIHQAWQSLKTNRDRAHQYLTKHNCLFRADQRSEILRLLFFSYTAGYRPDILDTEQFAIGPNPLTESQTGVDWTHVLGGRVDDRYILLVERSQRGTSPSAIEVYLQWTLDRFFASQAERRKWQAEENIAVGLEAEPGTAFIDRLRQLTRVTRATVRTVRPNPGWDDLEKELGREAKESRAKKVEVIMAAKRNDTLALGHGIVDAIKAMAGQNKLDFAAIEGVEKDQPVKFNSTKYAKQEYENFATDSNGQVEHDDAWAKMEEFLTRLD